MQFNFKNKHGETLSGRLELPSTKPAAVALFAHCFTCSEVIIAPGVISKTLLKHNIGVLRFDFTGLGNSQGDFANTNFSSNVDDLIAAYNALDEHKLTPEILIGHSLGGAAVLKAAQVLKNIKAVATIGAPSDVSHVTHLFASNIDTIETEGQAEVLLAGRTFTIKKQFIDDLCQTDILKGLKQSKKALLIMHSPVDEIVNIEHAASIYNAATHPKSFISLDDANHLLTKRTDAEYAGEIIGAWCQRYLSHPQNSAFDVKPNEVVVNSRPGARFTQDVFTHQHHLVADEPFSVNGNDLGMNPYELLLAALGACTSMTISMYAEHKKIPLESVSVRLTHQKIHSNDCDHCETKEGMLDAIDKHIVVTGNLNAEQRQRIYEIAEKCPVNRTLLSEIKISAHQGE